MHAPANLVRFCVSGSTCPLEWMCARAYVCMCVARSYVYVYVYVYVYTLLHHTRECVTDCYAERATFFWSSLSTAAEFHVIQPGNALSYLGIVCLFASYLCFCSRADGWFCCCCCRCWCCCLLSLLLSLLLFLSLLLLLLFFRFSDRDSSRVFHEQGAQEPHCFHDGLGPHLSYVLCPPGFFLLCSQCSIASFCMLFVA